MTFSALKIVRAVAITAVCMVVAGLAICDAADVLIQHMTVSQQSATVMAGLVASAAVGLVADRQISRWQSRQ